MPLVSKVCNIPMARIAAQVMLGAKLARPGASRRPHAPHFGVKEAVFPFYMFPEVDPVLGPEMRSTGEVLGMAKSSGLAFYKAQQATKRPLPLAGDGPLHGGGARQAAASWRRRGEFAELGFRSWRRAGTREFLAQQRDRRRAGPEAARGAAQPRRRDQERRDPAARQHAGRQGERARRLVHPQGGHQAPGALHHDGAARRRRRRGSRRGWPGPRGSGACRSTTPTSGDGAGGGVTPRGFEPRLQP